MDVTRFSRLGECAWLLPPTGAMRAPCVVHATEALLRAMDDAVSRQLCEVACLPGIAGAAHAMPDAHWGYGFPIGGVAAFDPKDGGVVSAGGVGFDIACGVRTLALDLDAADIRAHADELADALAAAVPAGVGRGGPLALDDDELDAALTGGARWAVGRDMGEPEDLERCEDQGRIPGADPACVSAEARARGQGQMGTLGAGNHYLEVQAVADLLDAERGRAMGLEAGQALVSIHCGSRGLGHQIGTDYLERMAPKPGRRKGRKGGPAPEPAVPGIDRKSTRLNSSHYS